MKIQDIYKQLKTGYDIRDTFEYILSQENFNSSSKCTITGDDIENIYNFMCFAIDFINNVNLSSEDCSYAELGGG